MKVYVACHHPDLANELAAALVVAGHKIVSTWHTSPAALPARDDTTGRQVVADRNIDQIQSAEVLVLVASPEHVARTKMLAGGKFVEAGVAIGLSKLVFTIGGVENAMLHAAQVRHAADITELIRLLSAV